MRVHQFIRPPNNQRTAHAQYKALHVVQAALWTVIHFFIFCVLLPYWEEAYSAIITGGILGSLWHVAMILRLTHSRRWRDVKWRNTSEVAAGLQMHVEAAPQQVVMDLTPLEGVATEQEKRSVDDEA